MLFSTLLALLPLAAAAPVDLVKRQSFSGRATFYDVGLGACGGYNVASDFIVALNAPQYGGGYPGPNCGRALTISYGGKTATATVRDQCPGCAYGSLDLSRGLFNYFASEDVGVFQMSWSWADGSGGGNSQPEPTTEAPKPSPTPSPTPTSTYTPPSTTPSPSPTPTTTQQVQAQAVVSSAVASIVGASSASSVSLSSSASASASGTATGNSTVSATSGSGSVSASAASASSSASPGGAQILASNDGNLAAIAGMVVALGKIVITGKNETGSA